MSISALYNATPEQSNSYKIVCEDRLRNSYDNNAISGTNVFCTKYSDHNCEMYKNVIQACVGTATFILTTAPSTGRT